MAILEIRTDDGRVVWSIQVLVAPKPDGAPAHTAQWDRIDTELLKALQMEGRINIII